MSGTTITRSGRVSKKPERYEPKEIVEDDYSDSEYSDDDDDDDNVETDEETSEDEDTDLEGFVVEDKSDSDTSYNGPEHVPPLPVKKRPRAPAVAGDEPVSDAGSTTAAAV